MKIFISSDMEGTTGIVDWKETELHHQASRYFCEQMSQEVAAACEGANEGGADEIVIKDAHDTARNIDPSKLPHNAKIIRGWMKNPLCMMAGLDESFDGVLFTGYHTAAGTDGNPLSHTMSGQIQYLKINGVLASEFLINAYIAAYFRVPVLFLSGDSQLCDAAKQLNENIRTVAVSEGEGSGSTSIHPVVAADRIKGMVKEAVLAASADREGFMLELPEWFEIEVCYKEHPLAYKNSFYPGASREGSNVIRFESEDYMEVLRFFHFVL